MRAGDPTAHPVEAPSKERLRLWLRLLRATRLVENDLRERLRLEFGTTLPRFDVMAALGRHPDGLKMSELSRFLRVSNGNVTGIVDRLAEDGLVIRAEVPGDRRAARARLTPAGQAEFARQAAAHEAWVDGLMSDIEPELGHQMRCALSRIAAKIEE